MPRNLSSLLLAVVLIVSLASRPAFVSAAPPNVTYLYPAGVQRGQTVEITAGGALGGGTLQAWADRKGIDIKPGKTRGKFTVTVAADATPGLCWFRFFNEDGASTLRPFVIGTLPEVRDQEPNDDLKKPQVLSSSSVVVNGKLDRAGDVDCFAVKLRKGETVVVSVQANSILGSPMDSVLQLLSADGFLLEENNDDHGLDPQLSYTVPKDGSYIVRLFAFPAEPDSSIRFFGAETCVYRLTVTTGAFADHAFPLAVPRADPGSVEIVGWNIPDALKKLSVKPDADLVTIGHPQLANTVPLRVEPHPCVVKTKPNSLKNPQRITLPVTISGRIDAPGEVDVYEFPAKKGQEIRFRLDGRSIGSQLDPLLRLTDATGKRVAQVDDTSAGKVGCRDAELTFSAPADGPYRIEVRDLAGGGSFRHFYRLRALLPEPDYAIVVAADRFTVAAGKPLDIPVTIQRHNGFDRDVEVTIEGLSPNATATVKPVGKSATVHLESKGPVSSAFRIVGKVAGRADLTRTATAAPGTSHFWLTVTK